MPKAPQRIDHVEALKHLDPGGALSGLDLDDHEGMAIRAACNLFGASLTPPLSGNAAIRWLLKDRLISMGMWPADGNEKRD